MRFLMCVEGFWVCVCVCVKNAMSDQDRSMWVPTSAVAKGCIGNTALGALTLDSVMAECERLSPV